MKLYSFVLLVILGTSFLYGEPDSSGAGDEKFILRLHTGSPQLILHNRVGIAYEVNMFGRSELSFKGVVGVQLEPTSAYRHYEVNNIGRGDNIYMKVNDSTIYLLHINNILSKQIEIEFTLLPKQPPLLGEVPVEGGVTPYYRPPGEALKQRITFYVIGTFPLGQFAEVDFSRSTSGFAEFGVGGGASYMQQLSAHTELGGALLYTRNSLNEQLLYYNILTSDPTADLTVKSWDLLWLLGEGGYTGKILPFIDYYIHGTAGILLGYAPDITVVSGGNAINYLSGTTTTIGYGAVCGFRESNKIDVGMRFLNASGTFVKRTASSVNNLMNVQLFVGFIL
ncbi:MAG: hypothetical protein ACHQQQ_04340 [Bacteroidota bacterium]